MSINLATSSSTKSEYMPASPTTMELFECFLPLYSSLPASLSIEPLLCTDPSLADVVAVSASTEAESASLEALLHRKSNVLRDMAELSLVLGTSEPEGDEIKMVGGGAGGVSEGGGLLLRRVPVV